MRLLAALMVCAIIPTWAGAADARERRKEYRKPTASERAANAEARRPSTVDRRGLCVRDTGRPFHSLNLNSPCDREEFWARFNDLGDNRN